MDEQLEYIDNRRVQIMAYLEDTKQHSAISLACRNS
jgi:hypothetical protein